MNLQERLRKQATAPSTHPAWSIGATMTEAAARIDALESALRGVLDVHDIRSDAPLNPYRESKLQAARDILNPEGSATPTT